MPNKQAHAQKAEVHVVDANYDMDLSLFIAPCLLYRLTGRWASTISKAIAVQAVCASILLTARKASTPNKAPMISKRLMSITAVPRSCEGFVPNGGQTVGVEPPRPLD